MPSIGEEIKTEMGVGKVLSLDILKRTYCVNVPDEGRIEIEMKSNEDEENNK